MHGICRNDRGNPAFSFFSGPRPHQEYLPQLWKSDIVGGGVRGEGVLAAQWSVWAASFFAVASPDLLLAWTHPHTPTVPREAWGWGVPLHGVGTLWGSLVRVCTTLQRLPVRLPDCQGGTSEFLWLPFRLRKCVVVALQLSPAAFVHRRSDPCTGTVGSL